MGLQLFSLAIHRPHHLPISLEAPMSHIHLCSDKKPDGSPCPCRRFKKADKPCEDGSFLCYYCKHIEGAHPDLDVQPERVPENSQTSKLLEHVRATQSSLRLGEISTREEARQEALSNYRPGNSEPSSSSTKAGSSGKRTTGGKFTVKAKGKAKQTTSTLDDEDWIKVGTVILFPEGYEEHAMEIAAYSESQDPGAYTCDVPHANTVAKYENAGLMCDHTNSSEERLCFKASWGSLRIDLWLRALFPDAFEWVEREFKDRVEDDKIFWSLMVKKGSKRVTVFEKTAISGVDLKKYKTPSKCNWQDSTLYFVLHFSIPPYVWRKCKSGDWSIGLEVEDPTTGKFMGKTATKSGARPLVKQSTAMIKTEHSSDEVEDDEVKGETSDEVVDGVKDGKGKLKEDKRGIKKWMKTRAESKQGTKITGMAGGLESMLTAVKSSELGAGTSKQASAQDLFDLTGMTDSDEDIFPVTLFRSKNKTRRAASSLSDVEEVDGPSTSTVSDNLTSQAAAYTVSSTPATLSTHASAPPTAATATTFVPSTVAPVTTIVPAVTSVSTPATTATATTFQPPISSSVPSQTSALPFSIQHTVPSTITVPSSSTGSTVATTSDGHSSQTTDVLTNTALLLDDGSMTQAPSHYAAPTLTSWSGVGPTYGSVMTGSSYSSAVVLGRRPATNSPPSLPHITGFEELGEPSDNPWKKQRTT